MMYPTFRVALNGAPLYGVEALEISVSCNFEIGRFSFTKLFIPNDQFPPSWWAMNSPTQMTIAIELSIDRVQFEKVIVGNIDSHSYDPIQNIISCSGRDLGSLFIDQSVQTTYRNQTLEEIANLFASTNGLAVYTDRSFPLAGRFYATDYDQVYSGIFGRANNQWDLMCRLGSEFGVVPYVSGTTLYLVGPDSKPAFIIRFSTSENGQVISNVTEAQFERSIPLACEFSVSVSSWHSKNKLSVSTTVRASSTVQNTSASPLFTKYHFSAPNLTQQQCASKAAQIARDYCNQERVLTVKVPKFVALTAMSKLEVVGTNSDYDGIYRPSQITYSINRYDGLETHISARSASTKMLYDGDSGNMIGEVSSY